MSFHNEYAPVPSDELQLGRRRRIRGSKVAIFAILLALLVIFLFPLFWIVSNALQTNTEQVTLPLTWWPSIPQWHNFVVAWNTLPFGIMLWRSFIIVLFSTIGAVGSSVVCAYGFARIRFRGRQFIFFAVLATLMLPGIVTMIPVYLIMKDLGWLNTMLPLIVPAYFGGGAFNIFLLRQFMMSLPNDLEDAARIDGASTLTIFFRIFLPLLKPALAVVAWMSALASWGDFIGPLIYLTGGTKDWTFTLGLYNFAGEMPPGWVHQLEMAMAIISIFPVVILFFFVQRWLIEGINLTGVSR